jgi:membrane fusion protein (multidrug efflux system)
MDLSKTQITKTEIRAPFSGIVGLRQVSEGGYVSSSTLVSKLQQVDPMKLDFSVPEKYRNMLKSGTLVNFTVEGSEKTFSARLCHRAIGRSDHAYYLLRALCSNPGIR